MKSQFGVLLLPQCQAQAVVFVSTPTMYLITQKGGKYFLKLRDVCAGCKIHFRSFLFFLFSTDAAQKKPIEIATQRVSLWGDLVRGRVQFYCC